MFDTKKLTTTPTTQWEAIRALVKTEQELFEALFIMQSIVDNPEEEYKKLHIKKINDFLAKYKED